MEEVIDRIAEDHLEGVLVKADYIAARCPFHGVDRHPSFWLSRSTGAWGCFSCGANGSSIRWLLKELGVQKTKVDHLIAEAEKDRNRVSAISKIQRQKKAKAGFVGESTLPEAILGLWDMCPVSLLESGFTQEILQRHDIGFDAQRGRVTFPIRDIEGSLIGVSGRALPGVYPKYKVYNGWHEAVGADGKTVRVPGELGDWFPDYSSRDIRNHLYRGNFVFQDLFHNRGDYLIVVEGYKAALWLVQMGYEYVVALMGARMSTGQERLIRRMGVATYILLDNNDAGREGTESICDRLGICSFPVYRCRYGEEKDESTQPDDLNQEEVDAIFEHAERATAKRSRYGHRRR